MKIVFKDHLEMEIPEEEAGLLEKYSKVFVMSDGMIRKEEFYGNNKLEHIHYYKDIAETEEELRGKLIPYNVPFSIREREKYGDFIIINLISYTKDLIAAKWKFLADADDFIMCTQEIDMDSGKPIYEQTTKYIGEYSNDPDPNYCKFNYDSEGNFTYCDYNYVRDYESELFELDHLSVIKDRFNLTDEMYNYYLTADLLPPLK